MKVQRELKSSWMLNTTFVCHTEINGGELECHETQPILIVKQ